MMSLLARLQLRSSGAAQDSMQFAYLKTFHATGYRMDYQMELLWLYFIHSVFLTPDATVHFNFQTMYFRDDQRPFSLRRPWLDRKPIQINATALTEVHVIGSWYLNGEAGVLGVLQSNPEFLLAVTFEYRTKSWLFHGGVSQLGTYSGYRNPLERVDHQQSRLGTYKGFGGDFDSNMALNDYSIHPEFAAQYYF